MVGNLPTGNQRDIRALPMLERFSLKTNTHVENIVNHPRRIIGLAAVHNFRDLGGYSTSAVK